MELVLKMRRSRHNKDMEELVVDARMDSYRTEAVVVAGSRLSSSRTYIAPSFHSHAVADAR